MRRAVPSMTVCSRTHRESPKPGNVVEYYILGMTMKQFKVCLTSLLHIDFSEFEKERLILSCSLVDILAARKDGFFALFSIL